MPIGSFRRWTIELDDAIRCALDGDALLFIGAGLSFLSRAKDGERLPDGSALIDLLLEQPAGTGSKHTLDRVSGFVVRTKGVDFVHELLKKNLTVESVDDRLRQLYEQPWRRIYTTNYDNAIEVALSGKKSISSLTIDDPVSKAVAGSIIHINGYIENVSPANIQKGLVLTDHSYSASRLIESEWFKFFLRDLGSARAIIFAGYSLADLDIQRALISDRSLSRKTFFFISPDADALERDAISDYGRLVDGGIDVLTGTILDVSSDYDSSRSSAAFLSLAEVAAGANGDVDTTAAQKISQQLVFGRLPEGEVLRRENVFGNQPFLVLRRQDQAAIDALRKGPWRDILYVGELASGKTACALNMAVHLTTEGYRVYYASKGATLVEELRFLSRINDKIAVVFENYALLTEEIRDYVSRRPQLHRMVMTERAVTHDLMPGFIDNTPHLGPVFEVSLDRIDISDVPQFEALVNFGGFWGERAGASEVTRQRIISTQLESSLYKLLVEIIKSEKVQEEVRNLLAPIANDKRAMKLFISSFIVNVLGFRFSINDWQTVFDGQWVRRIMRNYSEQVRHFLMLQGDTIFPRTGMLSAHLLRTFADDDVVRECLVDLYERAIRSEENDPEFLSLRIALTRYGSIEPIFSDRKKSANIFRYYDEIRVFGGTRNNADYWLQVGIAATIHDDLATAEKAFSNAYAREKAKQKPNLKKIDNYFSRFEMRKAIEHNDPDDAFATFLRANERLKKQIFLEENRHYPFKTGRYYADIAAKHFAKWNEEQRTQFIREAKDIREKAFDWKKLHREFSADVEILIRETSTLLARIEGDGIP